MKQEWLGDFGNDYTDRNQYDWKKRVPMFQDILGDVPIRNILEVGSNTGLNLNALESLGYRVVGVEPNSWARNQSLHKTYEGTADKLPFDDDMFDLVFTCGVLIHVPSHELQRSMKEIIRVSARYILAIEYKSDRDEMIEYRSLKDMLWKRPFGELYKKLGLKLLKEGETDIQCHYWLFEK